MQDSQAILEDWTRLTFSTDQSVINTISTISMSSWPAYENYSGNLGIQTLTDILYTHYGANPISQEYNGKLLTSNNCQNTVNPHPKATVNGSA